VKDAVGQFREVLAVREDAVKAGVPSAREAQVALAEVTGRLCTTLVAVGDLAGAIDNCRRSRSVTETLLASTPDDYAMLATRAVNGAALGNALRLNRQLPEAAVSLEAAIGEQRDLLTRKPLDADVRRRLAVSHAYLANVQLEQKQADQAAHQYELAIEELGALAAADPANARTRTELSYMLNQRVQILMASGRKPEAVTDVRRALALLRAGTEQAGAGGEAFNEYAWALVSSEVEEVRDPAAALKYATRAIELAGSPNAVYLHTLAWAHYRLGQTADAVRALEQALGTLAPATGGPAVGLRRRIEADLAVFKSGGVK
jgi:tetratricopeptide (TPR) repeat protein